MAIICSASLIPNSVNTYFHYKTLLLLIIYAVSIQISSSGHRISGDSGNPDISDLLTVVEDSNAFRQGDVTINWSLPDISVFIGKLFNLVIPDNTFSGQFRRIKIVEKGKNVLPNWMIFEESNKILRGIPSEKNLGHNIELEAHVFTSDNDDVPKAKDHFTINIKGDDYFHSNVLPYDKFVSGNLRPIYCFRSVTETVATIVVDTDYDSLFIDSKISLMNDIGKYVGLSIESLKIFPVGNRPMFDSSALVVGPGDVRRPQFSGTIIQWTVGCGNVSAAHISILQLVETSSNNGTLSQTIRKGVIGWHVTNNHQHSTYQIKPEVHYHATGTPVLITRPPSQQNVPTFIVEQSSWDNTRIVPTMASPSFKEIYSQSPVPTPTALSIQPTQLIYVNPAATGEIISRKIKPSITYSSPGIYHPEDLIEPSMSLDFASSSITQTEALPTNTFMIPGIEASKTDRV